MPGRPFRSCERRGQLPAVSSVLFMEACTTTWTASQIKAVSHFVQDEFCLPWCVQRTSTARRAVAGSLRRPSMVAECWRPRTLEGVPAIWTPAQATGTNAAGVASAAVKCHEAVPLGYALVRSTRSQAEPGSAKSNCGQMLLRLWRARASRMGNLLSITMRRGPSTALPGAPAAQSDG